MLPFIIYMGFGYGSRRAGAASMSFLREMNRFTFHVFFPLMMFDNIYSIGAGVSLSGRFVGFAVGGVLLVLALASLLTPVFVKDRRQIPVLIQGVYRSNILLFAIPLTGNLFGTAPVALATALVVLIVPIYNVAAVLLLEFFSGKKRSSARQLLGNVLTNPLVMGVAAGLLFKMLSIRLPAPLMTVIRQYSSLTTPLALFILGGTLQFGSMLRHMRLLLGVVLTKLVLIPAAMLWVSGRLGFDAMESFVIFTLFATPVATATFPMSQAMGADGELAGELVVITTTCSVLTLFFWILLMQRVGMF